LSPGKGFDVLLKAVRELKASGVKLYCAMFGDGSMLEPLRALASDLQIESIVRLPGFRNDVCDLWRAADIAVIPSLWPESFGYTALEALSAGCAVVASAVGALPGLVSAESAILTKPGDVEGLAAAIRTLVFEPELRKQMQRGAQKRARMFTLDVNIEGVERVYASVLGR
jgi:glycosyltransferase involved in cell wall biosynthesis